MSRLVDETALIVSNEPVANRARILSSNIERMGFQNTVVTSAWPDELARVCGGMFDRIIVDAPCSGEGMMRKDETAVSEWSPANVELCITRQREILAAADEMLKTGGKLIYSTCTFEEAENDGMAGWMADHLGAKTVVEGVENERQLSYLNCCGCTLLQGDFLGEPMPRERYLTLIGRQDDMKAGSFL